MHSAARRIEDSGAWQETGTVVAVEGDGFTVETTSGAYRAKRAVGCLVCPEAGDLVLMATAREGRWVLSVLERERRGVATRLTAEGDLAIELPNGRLSVAAQEGVELASGAAVTMVAPSLEVHAPVGTVSTQDLTFLGGVVRVEAEKARVVMGALEQVVERVTQRAQRVYRFVEDFEQLRAGRVDYVARRLLELRGGSTAISAEELVKVDGSQVHIG